MPDLNDDLRALGVRRGDVVMIHASLRAIGPVSGGPSAVIHAIEDTVGPEGTLLMTLGAQDAHDWVNDRPEPERPTLLADAEPFDAAFTPAQPDVGWLAEVFRRLPGTYVTDHPEGRFGARGARARELTASQPWHHYYGPGSPLDRLCQLGGKVLRLGADVNTATVLHLAEYLVDLPSKREVRRYRRVLREGGACIAVVEALDDCHGIVDWPGDYFGEILTDFLQTGVARHGVVGRARSELLDAAELVAFGVQWMKQRFGG